MLDGVRLRHKQTPCERQFAAARRGTPSRGFRPPSTQLPEGQALTPAPVAAILWRGPGSFLPLAPLNLLPDTVTLDRENVPGAGPVSLGTLPSL